MTDFANLKINGLFVAPDDLFHKRV